MQASPGRLLVDALLHSGDHKNLLALDIKDEFLQQDEKGAIDYIKHHAMEHGSMPTKATIQNEVEEYVPTGVEVPEPPSYYLDQIRNRYLFRQMNTAMTETRELMKLGSVVSSQEEALGVMFDAVMGIKHMSMSHDLVDLRDGHDMLWKDYVTNAKGETDYLVKLGWPTIDGMAGGVGPGDVVTYVGRPGMGKTFSLLYSAINAWHVQKKRVLFLSMEMTPLPILQRVVAMHSHKPLTQIKQGTLSTDNKNQYKAVLQSLSDEDTPLWVVDGNLTATVGDLRMLCQQYDPDVVYIDGAYMMRPDDGGKYTSKWDTVTQVVEGLKRDVATRLGIPVIASYQFNRDMAKKSKAKKLDEIGLEDIGLSDSIGQISTLVMALLEDDSLESESRKIITVLKGRNGETGEFYINWDFYKMDFDEINLEVIHSDIDPQ